MAKREEYIIAIGGDTSQLVQSLKNVNDQVAKTGKELSTINRQLKFDPTNAQLLGQKMQVLDEKIATTRQKLQMLSAAQAEVDRRFSQGTIGAEQYRAFQREIQRCQNQLQSLNAERAGVERLARGFGTAAGEARHAGSAISDAKQAAKDLADYTKETVEGIVSVGAKAIATITAAATAAAALSVKAGMSFEKAMSQVVATMGTGKNTEDYEKLSAAAKEMGATTKFTATEAAEALNYMALAGYNCEKQIETLPVVLNAAAAGGMDLASASNMVTNSMSALGVSVEDVQHFTDEMARTAQKSNTSFAELGEAIISIGGTAKTLANGTHELNTLLGILGDNGIKASEAGVNLRQVMLNLIAGADKMKEQFGVNLYDKATGNMRELRDVFADLNAYMDGFNDKQKNDVLTGIFGDRTQRAARALLDGSVQRYHELYDIIGKCDGATGQMAKTMGDNLSGSLTIFKSGLEACGITIYEKFETPLKNAVRRGIEEVTALNSSMSDGELSSSLERLSKAFGELADDIIDFAVSDAIPDVIDGFEWIAKNGALVKSTIVSTGAAFVTWKVGSTISKTVAAVKLYKIAAEQAAVAQAAFNATLAINPFVLAAAATIGAAAGITALVKTSANAKDAVEELNDEMSRTKENAETASAAALEEEKAIEMQVSAYQNLRNTFAETGRGKEELDALASKLQETLGSEIEVIDKETGAYNDLTLSVEQLIEKKKLEQEFNARTDVSNKAIEQAAELEKELEQRKKEYSEWVANDSYAAENYTEEDWLNSGYIAEVEAAIDERKAIISEYQEWLENTYSAESAAIKQADETVEATAFAASLELARTSLEGYKESVSGVVSESQSLTAAMEEQAKSGNLSSETALKLIDSGYALCLELDKETGLYTLNREKVAALTEEKYRKIKADLEEQAIDLRTKYDEEAAAAERLRIGISSVAEARAYAAKYAALQESEDALAQLEAYSATIDASLKAVQNYKYTPPESSKAKEKTDSTDYWKQEAETQIKAVKHQYDMELIAATDYYQQLNAINQKYFAGREEYVDEYRQHEIEVYNGLKKAYNDAFENEKGGLDHLLSMDVIDTESYWAQLEGLVNRYYKGQREYAEEYRRYEEILYGEAINSKKRRLQEEKEALQSANDERQRQHDIDEANFELWKARNQKTVKVYSEAAGFQWERNAQDVAKAEENVKKLLVDKEVDAIDRLIDALDNIRNGDYTDPTTGIQATPSFFASLPDAELNERIRSIAGDTNYRATVDKLMELQQKILQVKMPSVEQVKQAATTKTEYSIHYSSNITVNGTADQQTRNAVKNEVKKEVEAFMENFVSELSTRSPLIK